MLRLAYFPNKQQDQPHIFSLPPQTFCRRTHIRTFSIKENGDDDDNDDKEGREMENHMMTS